MTSLLDSSSLHGLATLCVLCVIVSFVTAAPWIENTDDDTSEERWLEDEVFYEPEYLDDQLQADGPAVVMNDLCPPVPKLLPEGGCEVTECSSDRQCTADGYRCCYNGCVYTCLPELKPAPYIDWIREPRRRIQNGASWLVPGPDLPSDVELCTTTPPDDDSDPLMCPHGYECLIEDEGAPEKGIPNSGRCVRESIVTEEPYQFAQPKSDPDAAKTDRGDHVTLHACHLEHSLVLLSGHETVVNGKKCLCHETVLKCEGS